MLDQPFEKESLVSEDPGNSMAVSAARLTSSRAQVDMKEEPNSKSSRENRKNSSDMKNNSVNERQPSSQRSSSKIDGKSEMESLHQNISKLRDLVEEPEVKLSETDSIKLEELGLNKPQPVKLADLNEMSNDQDI